MFGADEDPAVIGIRWIEDREVDVAETAAGRGDYPQTTVDRCLEGESEGLVGLVNRRLGTLADHRPGVPLLPSSVSLPHSSPYLVGKASSRPMVQSPADNYQPLRNHAKECPRWSSRR